MSKKNKKKNIKLLIILLVIVGLIVGGIIIYCNYDSCDDPAYDYKPVIYLYPEEKTEMSVKLGYPKNLTAVYPDYNFGWLVTAYPDGTLKDEQTGREYYSLYYECYNTKKYEKKLSDGFVVEKENITKFLEQKLAILGLNDRESEEFIIYWLPKLQQNNYVYIRFQTIEEIEKNMPLLISQKPDTLIRIMMEWKGLDKSIDIKPQQLDEVVRKGFTVVEWGATEIN